MIDRLSKRLIPDGLWALVMPFIPEFRARPQGGGTAPLLARFSQWTRAWLWGQLHHAVLDELSSHG